MQTYSNFPLEPVLATGPGTPAASATPCPVLAAVKARAKLLKKWRKHEHRRLFFSWCACLHALGFSF